MTQEGYKKIQKMGNCKTSAIAREKRRGSVCVRMCVFGTWRLKKT